MSVVLDDANNAEVVGFTFYAGEDRVYNENEIVLYEHAVTSYGDFYNPATASFVCPVHGMYLFSATTMVNGGSNLQCRIMRNSAGLTIDMAYGNTGIDTGSNPVVTECDVGDIVWVRVHHSASEGTLGGYSDAPHTTFSGVLIKAL